ncbi:MAG: heparinase II/III family protein [Solirubrobacterales bacterium]
MTFGLAVRGICADAVAASRYRWERARCLAIHGETSVGGGLEQTRWMSGCAESEPLRASYRELFPGSVEATIFRADLICEHLFDLLGSGPVRLSPGGSRYQSLDWHRDLRSGYRWGPDAFHRDIQYGHIRGVDVKSPWELSRFQHLHALGQAYVFTRRPKYRTEFIDQIDDWIRSNRVGFGVNWACTMDVAIRAANWLACAEYFLGAGGLDEQFLRRFYTSLHEHGKFIRGHLERSGGETANHYLADIAGLLFIAVYCPFLRESRRWRRFCIRELIREMDRQVYADGCHFEASTCYHRLALELFFFATWLVAAGEADSHAQSLSQVAERAFGRDYVARLHSMFAAVLHLLKPNGKMPQVGDNDSGRFLILGPRPILDMRYLLALGAVFFEDSQFKVREFGLAEDVLWLFGTRGRDAWIRLEGRSATTIGGRAFPDAGWYVIRRHPDYCLVSCGPNGANGRGGHAHNDKLSIELMLDGRDVVVDPGTYLYTSNPIQRNLFRATGSHNTVAVDGREQAELPADLFRLPEQVRIRRAEWKETAGRASFTGAIEYAGIAHERTVAVDEASGRWIVEDHIVSPCRVGGRIAFHLAPGLAVRDLKLFDRGSDSPVACMEAGGAPVETGTYQYSPEYGVAVRAPCISIRVPDVTNATIRTVFAK